MYGLDKHFHYFALALASTLLATGRKCLRWPTTTGAPEPAPATTCVCIGTCNYADQHLHQRLSSPRRPAIAPLSGKRLLEWHREADGKLPHLESSGWLLI